MDRGVLWATVRGVAESDRLKRQSTPTCLVVLFLVFRGTSILFPYWLRQFTLSPTLHKGSLFCVSLLILVTSCLFDNNYPAAAESLQPCPTLCNYPNRHELVAHCGFCVSLMIWDFEPLFTYLLASDDYFWSSITCVMISSEYLLNKKTKK